MTSEMTYHAITAEHKPEFVARGYKGRYFFPHEIRYVRRPGCEQFLLLKEIWGIDRPANMYNVLIYGVQDVVSTFPDDLWFHPQVMMHRLHLGLPGLVCWANMCIDGDRLLTDEIQSDVVQHIFMLQELKRQVNARFRPWYYMVLNGVLNFAIQQGLREILIPTPEHLMSRYLDKPLNTQLFERIYRDNIHRVFVGVRQRGNHWVVDVQANRGQVITPELRTEPSTLPGRRICLFHDVSPGPGQRVGEARRLLNRVLEQEQRLGVRSTYTVAGALIGEEMERIEQAGHAVGFHSYSPRAYRYAPHPSQDEPPVMRSLTRLYRRADYTVRKHLSMEPAATPTASVLRRSACNRLRRCVGLRPVLDPLALCRTQQLYAKGYHPTEHDTANGVSDDMLLYRGFEWVLTPPGPGDAPAPGFNNGLVRLPVTAELTGTPTGAAIERFQADALRACERGGLVVLGLPTASSASWLAAYPALIERLRSRGGLVTAQQVSDTYHLTNAV